MRAKKLPSREYLLECFWYDPDTGKLFWKKRPAEHFTSLRTCNSVNVRFAGKEAFTHVSDEGYRVGSVNNTLYKAHRIIWKLVTGQEPSEQLDHRDRNPGNNRFDNLRVSSNPQNQANKVAAWNSSGVIGVRKRKGSWEARIHKNRRCIYLGFFRSFELAVQARKAAEKELYGEFAP